MPVPLVHCAMKKGFDVIILNDVIIVPSIAKYHYVKAVFQARSGLLVKVTVSMRLGVPQFVTKFVYQSLFSTFS